MAFFQTYRSFLLAALAALLFASSNGPAWPEPAPRSRDCRVVEPDIENGRDQSPLQSAYRRVWQLVRDNTMYPERLENWAVWENRFAGRILKEEDLECAVSQMLGQLHDQYTFFRSPDQTRSRALTDDERDVVQHRMFPDYVGYIYIETFCSHRVAEELQLALVDLKDARSLVLDLRDNKGGYVEQALQAFSLLVSRGKFVTIQGRQDGEDYFEHIFLGESEVLRVVNGRLARELRLPNLSGDKPLIVLVNDGTRSAAEMLAGALRDIRNARLVGAKTFGKGVVQGTWYLDSGASIKIAMARFFLPGGESINGRGIRPDVEADFSDENARVPDKALPLALLRAGFPVHGAGASGAAWRPRILASTSISAVSLPGLAGEQLDKSLLRLKPAIPHVQWSLPSAYGR